MAQMDEVAKKVGIKITAEAETHDALEDVAKGMRTFKEVCKDAAATAKAALKGLPEPMIAFMTVLEKGGPEVQAFFEKLQEGGKNAREAMKQTVMEFQQLIPLTKDLGDVDKGFEGIARSTRLADIALGQYASTWFFLKRAVQDVLRGIDQAIEMAAAGARAEDLVRGFDMLATRFGQNSRQITADMIEMSHETINQYQAAEMGAMALMMTQGKIGDRLGELMKMARVQAMLTGRTVNDVYLNIVRNMTSGYTLGLKRLGMMVDFKNAYKEYADSIGVVSNELDEETKLLLRINETMEVGGRIVADMGGDVFFAADAYRELKTDMAEARIEMGKLFDMVMRDPVEKVFIPAIEGFTEWIRTATAENKEFNTTIMLHQAHVIDVTNTYEEYYALISHLVGEQWALTESFWAEAKAGADLETVIRADVEAFLAAEAGTTALGDATAETTALLDAAEATAERMEQRMLSMAETIDEAGISLEGLGFSARNVLLDLVEGERSIVGFLRQFPQLVGDFGDIPERMWELYNKQQELGLDEANELASFAAEHPAQYSALVALQRREEEELREAERVRAEILRSQTRFLREYPHLVEEFGGVPGRMWDLYIDRTTLGMTEASELAAWADENPAEYSALVALLRREEQEAKEAERMHKTALREQERMARELERIQKEMSAKLKESLGLEETEVTWLDMQLTYVGEYVDKWDEYARRLRAAVEPGSIWEFMLPGEIRGKGAAARQSWVDEQLKVFYAGLMPEEIDWAAVQRGIITTVQRTAQFAGSAWEQYMPADIIAGSPQARRQWISEFFNNIFAGQDMPGAVDWGTIKDNIMRTFARFEIELGPDALFQGEMLGGNLTTGFDGGLAQGNMGEEVQHRLRQDIRENAMLHDDVYQSGEKLGRKLIEGIAEEIEGTVFRIHTEVAMVDIKLFVDELINKIDAAGRTSGENLWESE